MGSYNSKNNELDNDYFLLKTNETDNVYHINKIIIIDILKPSDNFNYKSITYHNNNNNRNCMINIKNEFVIDNIISSDHEIYLGTIENVKQNKEFIKIGKDNDINRIIDYTIKQDIIIYEFENGIYLDVFFDERMNDYYYMLTTKHYRITKKFNITKLEYLHKSTFHFIIIHNFIK